MFLRNFYKIWVVLSCFWIGYFAWTTNGIPFDTYLQKAPELAISKSNFDKDIPLSRLEEAYNVVSKEYYGFSTVDKEAILHGMIKGMVDALGDKHSEFLDEAKIKELNEAIWGNFEGIGAYVWKIDQGVLIRQVFDFSPAKEGGLKDGDIIEKVGGESTEGLTIEEAVKKIRWPAGSSVTLSILRLDGKKEERFEKNITRKQVKVPSVVGKMLSGSTVGVITVWIFGETTPEEFNRTYNSLTASGMTALVLDLRDNPGGLLSTSVSLLSNFVENGKTVVETRGNDSELNQKYHSEWIQRKQIPMAVLINENSASASEITAGALQDYKIALIVGEKSYGKGSVQEPIPLKDGSELKLTIARWYTPNGKWIDKIGINPDIPVKILPEDYEKKYDRVMEKAKEALEFWKQGKTYDQTLKQFTTESK